MGLGGLGNTISFGIRAIADLKGVDQTAKALTGLGAKGGQAGQGISKGMDAAARSLDASRAKADAVAHSMRGITVAAAAVVGLGVGLFKIGASFDSVLDSIQSGTGATGDALAQLGSDARAVFRSIPTDLETAGTAITELSKRTSQSGKGLQDLAAAEIELARITGGDLKNNIEVTAKLFENWGVTVENQVGVLDELFRASQATGIPVNKLAQELTQFGPILRSMGFGLDESIALLAVLDKAGVDAAQVITGLRTAISKFSASGVTDLGAALQDVFNQIKNAPTDVEAAAIAIENFGSRAGPAFAENIRAGRLSYEDLIKVIKDGDSTILGTARATNDAAEKFKILKNRVIDAAIPIGSQFFDAVNKGLPALETLVKGIGIVGNTFSKLPGPVKAAAAGVVILAVGLAAVTAVGARVVSIGFSTAAAWSSVAAIFSGTAVAADAATVSMAAAGVAAETSAVGISALAVAETELAGSAAAATTANAGLIASLARIATFGVIAVSLEIGIDAITKSQSGKPAQFEQIAAGIVSKLADAIRAVGGDDIADALQDNVDAAVANMSGREVTLELGFNLDQKTSNLDKAVEDVVHGVPGGTLIPDSWIPDVQHADDVISELGITVDDVQKKADEAGVSFTDMLVELADQAGVTTPAIEAYKQSQKAAAESTADATDAIAEQVDTLAQQVEAQIASKKAQDELSQAVKDTLNQQFIASQSAKGLLLPFTRDAEDAEQATLAFNVSLEDMETAAVNAANGVDDIASSLPGVQAGFGKVGTSLIDVFRQMDNIGVLNLTPAAREALDFVSTLQRVEGQIDVVNAKIQNNQGDMSMWQARISLVTDAFGANSSQINDWIQQLETGQITQEQFNAAIAGLGGSGGFPRLDALLAQGKISQSQYAQAVKAGTYLLQRSAGALQDEDAELVANIISLAGYVKAHDDANAGVKTLTDSQRGFLAAMQDSRVQTFLQTLQLLLYLESVGQIPEEKVTKFIADSAAANPVIDAIVQDLGLLEGDHEIPVSANVNNAINSLQQVKGVIVSTTADGATITVSADTQEAAQKFIDLNRDQLSKLDGRELVVQVKGDDGKWQTTYQTVLGQEIPDKTVTVKAEAESAIGQIPILGGIKTGQSQPDTTVTQPEPIVFTAEDQVTPVTEEITANMDSFATDVAAAAVVDLTTQGQAAGDTFLDGLSSAIVDSSIREVFNPVSIDATIDLSQAGHDSATSFVGGLQFVLSGGAVDTGRSNSLFNQVEDASVLDLSTQGYDAAVSFVDGLQAGFQPEVKKRVIDGISTLSNDLKGSSLEIPFFADIEKQASEIDLSDEAAIVAASFTDIFSTNLGDGTQTGIDDATTIAQNAAIGLTNALNVGAATYNFGFNNGFNYGVGVANGITAMWNSVFNAGFSLGQAANAGTAAGMQAHSPSRLAIAQGKNWADSFASSIRAGIGNVRSAGHEMSAALQGTIVDPSVSPAMRALLTVDTRPQHILAQSIDRERGGSRSTVVNQHNHVEFHGVTDTKEIVTHVSNEFNRALDRGMTAGLFGQ